MTTQRQKALANKMNPITIQVMDEECAHLFKFYRCGHIEWNYTTEPFDSVQVVKGINRPHSVIGKWMRISRRVYRHKPQLQEAIAAFEAERENQNQLAHGLRRKLETAQFRHQLATTHLSNIISKFDKMFKPETIHGTVTAMDRFDEMMSDFRAKHEARKNEVEEEWKDTFTPSLRADFALDIHRGNANDERYWFIHHANRFFSQVDNMTWDLGSTGLAFSIRRKWARFNEYVEAQKQEAREVENNWYQGGYTNREWWAA